MRTTTLLLISAFLGAALPLGNRAAMAQANPGQPAHRKVARITGMNPEDEIAYGRYMMNMFQATHDPVPADEVSEYVNRIAQNLANQADPDFTVTVTIVRMRGIEAGAFPGGFLWMSSGTIEQSNDEAEVAAVLAHEIAHVACRHWASKRLKQAFYQWSIFPLMLVTSQIGSANQMLFVAEGYLQGDRFLWNEYTRGEERQADALGVQYLAEAGYDPHAFAATMRTLFENERREPNWLSRPFRDHPETLRRIAVAEESANALVRGENARFLVTTSDFAEVKKKLTEALKSDDDDVANDEPKKPASETDSPPVIRREPANSRSGSAGTAKATQR